MDQTKNKKYELEQLGGLSEEYNSIKVLVAVLALCGGAAASVIFALKTMPYLGAEQYGELIGGALGVVLFPFIILGVFQIGKRFRTCTWRINIVSIFSIVSLSIPFIKAFGY